METILNVLPGSTTLSSFTYGYDAGNRITAWTQLTAGTTSTWNTISYSAIDQLTGVTVSNGSSITDSYSYSYDTADNPLGKLHNTTSTSFTVSEVDPRGFHL